MQIRLPAIAAALSLLALAGCALNAPYTADLTAQTVQSPSLMIAKPLPRTLVVMVSPDKIADSYSVKGTPHGVKGFRPFFEKTLRQTLSPYFQKIEFVEHGSAVPAEPHVVADVRIDGIETSQLTIGQLTYVVLNMGWAFAVRPSESTDYLFSYAGVANSEVQYYTLDIGCQQLMKSAMHGLLQGWTEKDVHKDLRAFIEAASTPPPSAVPAVQAIEI